MNIRQAEDYSEHYERIDTAGLEDVYFQASLLAEDDAQTQVLVEHFLELNEAFKNLSKTTGIIGYLESQLESVRKQEQLLNDVEKQAARTSELEEENQKISRAVHELSHAASKAAELKSANKDLIRRLDQLTGQSTLLSDAFDEFPEFFARNKKLSMSDYYEMLGRSIRNTTT